jgi:oligopeptidase B
MQSAATRVIDRRLFLMGSAAVSVLAACSQPVQAKAVPVPPVAKKVPKTITQLGRTREDEYQWIKDDRWQEVLKDPSILKKDVHDYLTAENAYHDAMMESAGPNHPSASRYSSSRQPRET